MPSPLRRHVGPGVLVGVLVVTGDALRVCGHSGGAMGSVLGADPAGRVAVNASTGAIPADLAGVGSA
ncbi:hypothetical protein ABT404_24985 [Streptomyces hyaluromycini]|uniref:Uncharacterized protein n=1 Tax=Streptomyces hyaluromycini TaxID=1377993 RepID=A0ABV1X109_9ACTN